MKLHTNTLDARAISRALRAAMDAGVVANVVAFDVLDREGSRSRAHAYEVQLGVFRDFKVPGDGRRPRNTGRHGAGCTLCATYDEWGHFIARLFAADPHAIFGPYKGRAHFHAVTNGAYRLGES